MLPTLDEFLARKYPTNGYIKYRDFKSLYIRKGPLIVRLATGIYQCDHVITLANITARKPGTGALKRLVADLVTRGQAVYVENVHEPWFREKLLQRGFLRVDEESGFHYLFNYDGHLTLAIPNSSVVTK